MSFITSISQLSYSRIKCWEKCPQQAKFKFVQRLKEPGSAASERGKDLHKLAEQFMLDPLMECPPELKPAYKTLTSFRRHDPKLIKTELQLAFDKNWNVVTWFHPTVWMRAAIDLMIGPLYVHKAIVADYKTGKRYPDHDNQLGLYALCVFKAYDWLNEVETDLVYTDLGARFGVTYLRSEVPTLEKEWMDKANAIFSDDILPPNPGTHCRWCYFRKSNGGPCQFG